MEEARKAAVAILRDGNQTLLIKRKPFPGDPWSGHIAFPGGHINSGETLRQGLLREVREEVMLDLSEFQIHGELEPVHPHRAPYLTVYPMIIDAHNLIQARSGPEVEDIRVVDIRGFVEKPHPENGFPALDYSGWIVWGLTYRIIMNYLNGVK